MPLAATSMPRVATMGWMPDACHQRAVDRAEGGAREEPREDGRDGAEVQERGDGRRRHRHHRAERDVDPARPDRRAPGPSDTMATGTTWTSWSRRLKYVRKFGFWRVLTTMSAITPM